MKRMILGTYHSVSAKHSEPLPGSRSSIGPTGGGWRPTCSTASLLQPLKVNR